LQNCPFWLTSVICEVYSFKQVQHHESVLRVLILFLALISS
jgi:hypothetical protein